MSNTYATRNEAIQREIIEPLGEYVNDYDVDAIAEEVLGGYAEGYALIVDAGRFVESVASHLK